MLNSDLVLDAAQGLAADLLGRQDLDDAARIVLLYERSYGRPPDDAEQQRGRAYLERFAEALKPDVPEAEARRLRAWQLLCQVVVAGNEFLYVK